MQLPRVLEKPPVGVVFDCDMAGIDDALALALLYGLDGKRESRVVSMSLSRPSLKAAAFCDAVSRFYAGPAVQFMRMLPVGMGFEGQPLANEPMLTQALAKPAHKHTIEDPRDTADPAALIRNAFTAHHDGNCLVVLAGPAANLLKALSLPGVKDMVAAKVRLLSVAPAASDIEDTNKLLGMWPAPVVVVSPEIGSSILYPGANIETGFAWTPAHPVVDAYKAFQPMPYDAPTGAVAAALHAVRPEEKYFQVSEPGTITVLDGGRLKLTPSAEGKHRQLLFDPEQRERVVKAYTDLASAKPVPRMPRFRPKPDEAKPPA